MSDWNPIERRPPKNEILVLTNEKREYAYLASSNDVIEWINDNNHEVKACIGIEGSIQIEEDWSWKLI